MDANARAIERKEIEETLDSFMSKIAPVVARHGAGIQSGLIAVANALNRQAAALEKFAEVGIKHTKITGRL